MNIEKGETKIFEFTNEINPSDEVHIKATIYLKDYGEAKIFDNTKIPNKRNLQVKMKWPSKKRIIQGKISFPTSIIEPLYLDLDVSVVNEVTEESVMKLISSSSIGFYNFDENLKNLSVSTKNVMELKNQKWEAGLEGVYMKEFHDHNEISGKKLYKMDNITLLTYYIPPELKTYLIHLQCTDHILERHWIYNHLLKAERPDVTPLHLQLDSDYRDEYHALYDYLTPHIEIEFNSTLIYKIKTFLKVCHRENFLYIFPLLDVDFSIKDIAELESNSKYYRSGHNEMTTNGKLECSSTGVNLPLCNQINLSFKCSSEDVDYYRGPWVANMTFENDNRNNVIDILNVKLRANYEKLRETRKSLNDDFGNNNIVGDILNTVEGDHLMKHSYNLEYNLRRKSANDDNNLKNKAVNGSYMFTKMFESWDFFEISDQHQWSQIDNGNLYIWTNLMNHTTDINQTSESATFSSQYVSLGEEESNNNITWMELRSSLDSNGFGLLQNILLQPSTLLNTYEGTINADLLIKTEFSPVKTFRVLVSHDHNKNENEDDESTKYDTLSELNVILNEKEISCTNFLKAVEGKMMGIGNTFMGKCRSVDGISDVTVKTFVVCPKNILDISQDNLVHVDVSSSWTNKDDDDTDLRISNDLIYGPTTSGLPMIRLTYAENSTDIDVGKNGSIFIFQNVANMEMTEELRLTETVISDSLDVLSFTQTSLQGISQQIVDDYFNVTNLNDIQVDSGPKWRDYNINVRSNIVIQGNSSNSQFNTKWFGFEERLYHCQSLYQICTDNGTNSTDHLIDTSNYCNLAILPAKNLAYALLQRI
ncbi:unnamed protein product [Orchesella dallaii]|uniref:Uncharacterized protein n=1 Tax=Orchesella dallaii TaxID=48710 RepID=A0ABP1Q573_9HEXA